MSVSILGVYSIFITAITFNHYKNIRDKHRKIKAQLGNRAIIDARKNSDIYIEKYKNTWGVDKCSIADACIQNKFARQQTISSGDWALYMYES
jgi:hypothetical protein